MVNSLMAANGCLPSVGAAPVTTTQSGMGGVNGGTKFAAPMHTHTPTSHTPAGNPGIPGSANGGILSPNTQQQMMAAAMAAQMAAAQNQMAMSAAMNPLVLQYMAQMMGAGQPGMPPMQPQQGMVPTVPTTMAGMMQGGMGGSPQTQQQLMAMHAMIQQQQAHQQQQAQMAAAMQMASAAGMMPPMGMFGGMLNG